MRIRSGTPIGSILRSARQNSGCRQDSLAKLIGVSNWTLCRVEKNKRSFDTDWISRMPEPIRSAVEDALREIVDESASARLEPTPPAE